MRITFLEPYPAPGCGAAVGGPRYRDEALVAELRRLGSVVAPLTATVGTSREEVDSFGTRWCFVHAAPDVPGDHESRWSSPELVDRAVLSTPDVLIVRAAGTRIAAEVQDRIGVPTVTILGGMSRTTKVLRSELLLTESEGQERYFRLRAGSGRLLRLPKLPAPEFLARPPKPVAERSHDLVVVAMFKPHKNHRALAPLFAQELDIVLIGDGETRPAVEAMARNACANTRFLGSVPPEIVASTVADSRLLVHPSSSEGFPRVIAEAMSVGTPPIALHGVVSEPVRNGVNGFLVTEEKLGEVVRSLANDHNRLQRASNGAIETFQREFSPAALSTATAELVSRLEVLRGRTPLQHRYDAAVRSTRRQYWDVESTLRRSIRTLRLRR